MGNWSPDIFWPPTLPPLTFLYNTNFHLMGGKIRVYNIYQVLILNLLTAEPSYRPAHFITYPSIQKIIAPPAGNVRCDWFNDSCWHIATNTHHMWHIILHGMLCSTPDMVWLGLWSRPRQLRVAVLAFGMASRPIQRRRWKRGRMACTEKVKNDLQTSSHRHLWPLGHGTKPEKTST